MDKPRRRPLRWLLWHPHQGLASGRLVGGVQRRLSSERLGDLFAQAVFAVDTSVLGIRALGRRVRDIGVRSAFAPPAVPGGSRIVYVDLGTHHRGEELAMAALNVLPRFGPVEAYGFEANPRSAEAATEVFAAQPVTIINAAIAHPVPDDGTIELFVSRDGRSDSIHRRSDTSVSVPAIDLSEFLLRTHPDLERHVLIIRMNIEGAEFGAIQGLIESGIAEHVDGWFGMWDDVDRIDPDRGTAFRRILSAHRIATTTFNERDHRWPMRDRVIAYELATAVGRGSRRIRSKHRTKADGGEALAP